MHEKLSFTYKEIEQKQLKLLMQCFNQLQYMLIIENSPYMDIKQSPRCIEIRLSIVIEFDLIQIMIENPIHCQS